MENKVIKQHYENMRVDKKVPVNKKHSIIHDFDDFRCTSLKGGLNS